MKYWILALLLSTALFLCGCQKDLPETSLALSSSATEPLSSSVMEQAYSFTESGLRITFPVGVQPISIVPGYALDADGQLWQWRRDTTAFSEKDPNQATWSFEPLLMLELPIMRSIHSAPEGHFPLFCAIDSEGNVWTKGPNGFGILLQSEPLRYEVAMIATNVYFRAIYSMQMVSELHDITSVHLGRVGVYFRSPYGGTLYRVSNRHVGVGVYFAKGETNFQLERLGGHYFTKEDYPDIDQWLLHPPEAFWQEQHLEWVDYWDNGEVLIVLDSNGVVYFGSQALLTTELEAVENIPKIVDIQPDGGLVDTHGRTHWIIAKLE